MRKPSSEERAAVAAAVHAAEAGTSGEIVTVVADTSDAYHDVGLHYAVLAMLLVPIVFAIFPAWPDFLIGLWSNGWVVEHHGASEYLVLFVVMTLMFLLVRYALEYRPLRLALTPQATRRRRVRRRAVELFKVGTEARTSGRTGILIYLSLGEHMAEIVADKAIHSVVPDDRWGAAMVALIAEVKQGRIADGMIAAVGQIGAVLSANLSRAANDVNELPDRLIEL